MHEDTHTVPDTHRGAWYGKKTKPVTVHDWEVILYIDDFTSSKKFKKADREFLAKYDAEHGLFKSCDDDMHEYAHNDEDWLTDPSQDEED